MKDMILCGAAWQLLSLAGLPSAMLHLSALTAICECYVSQYCLVILWQRPDVECFPLMSALKAL